MEIIKFSENMRNIISDDAVLKELTTGFVFTEGPVWDEKETSLYFTDFRMLKIYRWNTDHGLSVFRENSGRAIGLTIDINGGIIACESANRMITRLDKQGVATQLISKYKGCRLNSPNEVIVHSNGTIYFTDPYSISMGLERDIPFNGVYRFDPHIGNIDLLTDEFPWPNGLAFSPDEKILYINDTSLQLIKAYDVTPDGLLKNGRVFANLDTNYGQGAPDGMKVDEYGNVYVTGPGGIWVFTPYGERLGIICTPQFAANMCWGGEDRKTLFITASTSLYSLKLNNRGIIPNRIDM